MDPLYLDFNATTPLHPVVRDAMQEELGRFVGNPSSLHADGRRARKLVEDARDKLAHYLKVDPQELTFTSGGTESNNLMIQGIHAPDRPLWISAGEHPSLMEPARHRWRQGTPGATLGLDETGRIEAEALADAGDLSGGTVSLCWVNNETGTIQDLPRWSEEIHSRGAILHCDGAQGFFRLPQTPAELGVDAATLTAHKSFGPVGVGLLWLRRGLFGEPLMRGGPQEKQLRPGTEAVISCHGFGVLAELAGSQDLWQRQRLTGLQRHVAAGLEAIDRCRVVTPLGASFPNTISFTFGGLEAETILVRLDMAGISASSGSACSSGAREPSRVLKAMGLPENEIRSAIRFSYGPETRDEDLERALGSVRRITSELYRRHN